MARKYSRARGKSGSTKPVVKKVSPWVGYKPKEIEKLILKLAKAGKTSSETGMYLRDSYGIPDVRIATKKTITKILEENKISNEIPDDLMALMKRSIQVRKHMEKKP